MPATDGTWRDLEAADDDWRASVAPMLIASLALALAIALFLIARRLSGALNEPLAPFPLIATAAVLLIWACAIRLTSASSVEPRLRDRHFAWLPAATIAVFAVACSAPGHRAIDWLVWLSVFAAYGLLPATRRSPAISQSNSSGLLLQQLTRSRVADGREVIHGTLIAEFSPGERTATLHVAFCPPFERLPQVEAEAVDGDDCDVKIAQVLHQGARLEVRRSHATGDSQRVNVAFLATESPPPAV